MKITHTSHQAMVCLIIVILMMATFTFAILPTHQQLLEKINLQEPSVTSKDTFTSKLNEIITDMIQTAPRNEWGVVSMDFKKLNAYFDQVEDYKRLLGSFAISYPKGGVKWLRSLGYLDSTHDRLPNEKTRYRIGSITKSFTAILTMRAIEKGLLTLDTPISQFFPKEKYPIPYSDKITIRDLLDMTSDLYNYTNDPEFNMFAGNKTVNDILSMVYKHGADQRDPEQVEVGSYTNTGYYLLGLIIPKVFDWHDYRECLEQELTGQLRLSSISVYSEPIDRHPAPFPRFNEAESFNFGMSYDFEPNTDYTDSSVAGGAGAIQCHLDDLMAVWERVFLKEEIINKESVRLMQNYKPIVEGMNYGFGIYQMDLPGSFGHDGVIDGFYSHVSIWPLDPDVDPVDGGDYFLISYSINGLAAAPNTALNKMVNTGYGSTIEIPDFDVLDNDSLYTNWTGVYHGDEALGNINITIAVKEFHEEIAPNKHKSLYLYQTNPDGTVSGDFPLMYNGGLVEQHPGDLYLCAMTGASVSFINTTHMTLTAGGQTYMMTKYPAPPDNDDKGNNKTIYYVLGAFSIVLVVAIIIYLCKSTNNKQKQQATNNNYYALNDGSSV